MRIEEKLKLAINTLETIKNWDEESEDLFGDPGACASETLKRLKQ